MVYFRKRLTSEILGVIIEMIIRFTRRNRYSRADATIFYRYAESRGLDMTFSEGWDLSSRSYSISDYAIKPMSWCFDRGIMQRYWEILSAPQHAPSRADTAFMFRNFAYELEMN